MPQEHDNALAAAIAAELPAGTARDVFLRAVEELGEKLRDSDLEALRMMAMALYNSLEAQRDVEERGMFEDSMYGRRPNPALKVARDEAKLYLHIADMYALTFVSRLRAGVLQLAGQSLFAQLQESMAGALAAKLIGAGDAERIALEAAAGDHKCADCGRMFATKRGLAVHRHHAHPPKKKAKAKKKGKR